MMISDGNGTQADSMPMRRATPTYPVAEMVAIMKWAMKASIFSVIRGQYTCGCLRAGFVRIEVAQEHNNGRDNNRSRGSSGRDDAGRTVSGKAGREEDSAADGGLYLFQGDAGVAAATCGGARGAQAPVCGDSEALESAGQAAGADLLDSGPAWRRGYGAVAHLLFG